MTLKSIKNSLLLNIFDLGLSENEVLSYVNAISCDDETILSAYHFAIIKKFPNVARAFLKKQVVLKKFTTINSQLNLSRLNQGDEILKYPLLLKIYENKNLDEIICTLLDCPDPSVYRRRLIKAMERHGTILLNNLVILRYFIDLKLNFDVVLSLDHSTALSIKILWAYNGNFEKFDWLNENYGPKRIFKILQTFEENIANDCFRMLENIRANNPAAFLTRVREILGRKPQCFFIIHEQLVLLVGYYSVAERKLELKQDIEFLEGKNVKDFVISVPKKGEDLIRTGIIQRNCVGSYVNDVQLKTCQILNLLKDDKIFYTVGLKKRRNKFYIFEFKGFCNSNEMECEAGREYRKLILEMINAPDLSQK